MSGCIACARRMYYFEREALPQDFCFPCACARGIDRICDRARYEHLAIASSRVRFAWWRWTVYLEHALQWSQLEQRRAQA